MSDYNLPGPGDQCFCGCYYGCRCPPEPDVDGYHDASYEAGYEACLADGYDDRPGTEWIYLTGHRCVPEPGPDGRPRLVHIMTELRFAEFTWRRSNRTVWAYRRWFECQYGYDLESYLAGYDDAGAGLPSAVDDPDRHRAYAEALDAYEPEPSLNDEPLGPWPAPGPVADSMPF